MLHIIEFNMDEWRDQERYFFFFFNYSKKYFQNYCSFLNWFIFQSQVWGLSPFQYFNHVPHILRHCAQHHGRSFWRTWPRHQTLISEKWPNIVKKAPKNYNIISIQKTPHILHHCAQHHGHSFWRTWLTHQTLILSVRLCFLMIFFIYKIGCTTALVILW